MSNIALRAQGIAGVCGEELVESVLRRLAELEIGRYDLAIDAARRELAPFESRFARDSISAWESWQRGELGDDAEVMEWMALTDNLRLLLEKRAVLAAGLEK